MTKRSVECSEVAGKIVGSLHLHENERGDQEIAIDFTDGTSFSCVLESKVTLEARLIRLTAGIPEMLRDYMQ